MYGNSTGNVKKDRKIKQNGFQVKMEWGTILTAVLTFLGDRSIVRMFGDRDRLCDKTLARTPYVLVFFCMSFKSILIQGDRECLMLCTNKVM